MKPSCIILLAFSVLASDALGCTSMIVSASKSESGRPLLWKHRDTDADNNFLAKVEPTDSTAGYVGLFNAGDSLLSEAWMGMNDRGFAIMNTASYNVADHESPLADREAAVMTEALKYCTTVDDFASLLDILPKPLGVQANFGVIDAHGGAAYFETDDRNWVRYNVDDSDGGYIIRTNFSHSGDSLRGYGYIRYATAQKLVGEHNKISACDLTENFSKQFYHSLHGRNFENDSIVYDADFIPRRISTSSLVVEGVLPGEEPDNIKMWGCLGYPPCSVSDRITLYHVPEDFRPDGNWRSPAADRAALLRSGSCAMTLPEGNNYLDMRILMPVVEECRKKSYSNWISH